jgi:hypothetical protein
MTKLIDYIIYFLDYMKFGLLGAWFVEGMYLLTSTYIFALPASYANPLALVGFVLLIGIAVRKGWVHN